MVHLTNKKPRPISQTRHLSRHEGRGDDIAVHDDQHGFYGKVKSILKLKTLKAVINYFEKGLSANMNIFQIKNIAS